MTDQENFGGPGYPVESGGVVLHGAWLTGPRPLGPPEPTGWRQQWARVLRWFDDLGQTYAGRPALDAADPYFLRDRALAFFVFCYHVADWLKSSEPGIADPLRFARLDPALRICRDLANGSKHLTLDGRATARDRTLGYTEVEMRPGPPRVVDGGLEASFAEGTIRLAFTVTGTVDGHIETKDAHELAAECVTAWRGFFAQQGLGV